MDPLAPIKRFDRYQQQRRWLAVPVAVLKKFSDDQAGNQAALVAYYAFFSLFPLLLAFTTILGFVLHGDSSALDSVKSSVLGRFPVIGSTLQNDQLKGHALALVIGVALSLYAGLGVTQAANHALDNLWAVPRKHRPNFIQSKARGLALLGVLGGMFLLASAASGLVSGGLGGVLLLVVGIVFSVIVNVVLFVASFELLCSVELPVRSLLPGAVLAAILWEILQVVGGVYIHHIEHSDNAYGVFALVLGVITWLHLGAQMTIYSAELNVVLDRKLWPRSLFGAPPTAADEETLVALAKVEERNEQEQIDVSFLKTDGQAAPDPDAG